MSTAAVSLRGIGMSFGAHRVLDGVDLDIAAGEVLALLGANGAGKSTLIKVLSGVHPGHDGTIRIEGTEQRMDSPLRARRAGIATVHQRVHDGVVPGLTVAENLAFDDLAHPARRGPSAVLLRRREVLAAARTAVEVLGLDWSDAVLRRDVAELGISDAQLLVLARALVHRPRLLVLDEPTSALSAAEADRLFAVVRGQRAAGLAVLYVSHRLGEVDALADRAVVLRDGRVTSDTRAPFRWDVVLPAMLGERAAVHPVGPDGIGPPPREPLPAGDVAVRLRGVRLLPRSPALDLDLHAGQVTGVVGLLGAGKSELAHGLFGSASWAGGTAELDGRPFAPRSPAAAVRAGVHLVPEDRAGQALLPGWSIARTLSLPFLRELSRGGVVDRATEADRARTAVDRFGVVTRSESTDVGELSGGNQQKVVVGRWLVPGVRVLLLDEPFRGVDLGARRDIGGHARDAARAGAAVVVLSADVDEVLEVADRVLVLVDGAVTLDAPVSAVPRDAVVAAFSATSPGGTPA
ncbi:sugar ABC transporter ATP-binding protein [Trujillonella endophytica]|uniref:Monosaccharide ABC transporter ATP-binding protein, CUT2 family (TC 3.A.1.2.-) n=1 Tax=Trujillonella endophytica TaxID=673521 RepID=A0A1H8WNH9_9ACTN|nr:sugar ABC transporter ATP-binding protein [Trujillella endophytica]SEP29169.1 monosaccharide ABC transporter ATP-binding protein, CUT2 family (TC 3.A.1.2.-) [Trujillella endophytica]